MAKKATVPKTRNAGTMSEAGFWSMIRSVLRRRSIMWKPRINVLNAARIPYTGPNTRLKWLYKCSECGRYHPKKDVEIDHIDGVGNYDWPRDIIGFIDKLFCEEDKLRVLCCECHDKKTYNGQVQPGGTLQKVPGDGTAG